MKREVNKMKIEKDFKVFFADIWSTKTEPTAPDGTKLPRVEKPKDVVILLTDKEPIDEEYPDLFVAPISTEIDFACDRDLLLSADDNPLKQPIMIELWNSQPMLKQNLGELRGYLKKEQAEQLKRLHRSLYEGGIQISDVPTGELIDSEADQRMDFHKREIKETLYLRLPVQRLIEMRSQENAETVTKWQEDKTECREHCEIVLPPEQIRRIRNWTRKAVLLPEYASRLRENEIALSAFMESLLDYQLDTQPDNWALEEQFKFKPLIRFDVAPARSTLFDLAMVSINGWWIDVLPVSPKADGFVQIDRRIFDNLLADYYIPVQLEKSKDGGLKASILGYLEREDIEQLKLSYDKYRYCVDLEHFLPLLELWQKIAEKKVPARDRVILGEAIDFQMLDLELPVVDLPDAVYLRMLSSEQDAEQYILAKQRWEAEIDAWQTEQIQIAEALEKISPPALFYALIAPIQYEVVKSVMSSYYTIRIATALQADSRKKGRTGSKQPIELVIFDLNTGERIETDYFDIRYKEKTFRVYDLPERLVGCPFEVLFFDEEINQRFRELLLQSSLLKIEDQGLTASFDGMDAEVLAALLKEMGTVVPRFLEIPPEQNTVKKGGRIEFDFPEGAEVLSEDRFLVLIKKKDEDER